MSLIVLAFLLSLATAANILVVLDTPAYSHHIVLRSTIETLARRGHQLTVFSSFLDFSDNITSQHRFEFTTTGVHEDIYRGGDMSTIRAILSENFSVVPDGHLRHPVIQELFLSRPKFDLVIVECPLSPLMAFAHLADCPIVHAYATFFLPGVQAWTVGDFVNPAVHRSLNINEGVDGRLTLAQRFSSFFEHFLLARPLLRIVCAFCEFFLHNTTEKFPKIDFCGKVLTRIALTVNFGGTLGYFGRIQTSLPEAMLHLRSPHVTFENEEKKFDEKLEKFLKSSTKPLVLFSFGMTLKLSTLFVNLTDSLVNAITELSDEFDFILQNDDEIETNSKSLFITPKLSIVDLLRQPRTAVFVTHAGLRSIEEAIECEVPMVLIPIVLDQPLNAEYLEERGVAKRISLEEASKHGALVKAIREVASEKNSFRENLRLTRETLNDEFMTSDEIMIEHIDEILEFSAREKYVGYDFPNYQRLHLDDFSASVVMVYVVIKAFSVTVKCLMRMMRT